MNSFDFTSIQPLDLGIGHNPKEAMNTPLIRGLINSLVRHTGGPYLEIGTYRGVSLLAAAWRNSGTLCMSVDDFSQFDRDHLNYEITKQRIESASLSENGTMVLHRNDFRRFFQTWDHSNFRVYFYDGPHTYDDQLAGLELVLPILHPDAYIIVDDTNWQEVREANTVFRCRHGWEVVFERRTKANGSADWWNGIEVMKKSKS